MTPETNIRPLGALMAYTIGFGRSATGADLKTQDGKAAPDGLGTHSNSVIVYDVPRGAVRFKATAGMASTSSTGRAWNGIAGLIPGHSPTGMR